MLGVVRGRGVSVRYPAQVVSVSRDGEGVLRGVKSKQDGVETERESASIYDAAFLLIAP